MQNDGNRKGGTCVGYRLRERPPRAWEAPGRESCWDLIVSDRFGTTVLEDIGSTKEHAEQILEVFRSGGVDSITARCVMEDLLSEGMMLE